MSDEKLNEIKNEVQKILDNHLEENQRFSIQDLDEESIFLLIDLLLEKDDLERKNIWIKIQKKISRHKMNIELDYESVMEIKDKIDFLKNDFYEIKDLKNAINTDLELDSELNDI